MNSRIMSSFQKKDDDQTDNEKKMVYNGMG